MKVTELRNLAKELGIRGYTTANKDRLISLIETHEKTSNVAERVKRNDEATENKTWEKLTETPEVKDDTFEKAASKPCKTCNHVRSSDHESDAPTAKPAKEQKKRPSRGPNAWNLHLKSYREKNPGKSLKQAMGEAKESYHASKK